MLALLLPCLLALAGAAPRYRPPQPPPFDPQPMRSAFSLEDFMNDDLFDTRLFWEQLRREMLDLDAAIAELGHHFPAVESSANVDGNEFRVRIPLEGYDEKDITVKAHTGLLMVQAVHTSGASQRSYLQTMALPAGTDPTGSWQFAGGVLEITFPVRRSALPPATTPEPATTAAPEHSREEMGGSDDATQDADVGLERGDDDDVRTNEIPAARVEATTYAVDLKGEVEFVPVSLDKTRVV